MWDRRTATSNSSSSSSFSVLDGMCLMGADEKLVGFSFPLPTGMTVIMHLDAKEQDPTLPDPEPKHTQVAVMSTLLPAIIFIAHRCILRTKGTGTSLKWKDKNLDHTKELEDFITFLGKAPLVGLDGHRGATLTARRSTRERPRPTRASSRGSRGKTSRTRRTSPPLEPWLLS